MSVEDNPAAGGRQECAEAQGDGNEGTPCTAIHDANAGFQTVCAA